MKRVTVSVTLGDYWYCSKDDMRKIKQKMIEAAVDQSRLQAVDIVSIDAKDASNVRKAHA